MFTLNDKREHHFKKLQARTFRAAKATCDPDIVLSIDREATAPEAHVKFLHLGRVGGAEADDLVPDVVGGPNMVRRSIARAKGARRPQGLRNGSLLVFLQ